MTRRYKVIIFPADQQAEPIHVTPTTIRAHGAWLVMVDDNDSHARETWIPAAWVRIVQVDITYEDD